MATFDGDGPALAGRRSVMAPPSPAERERLVETAAAALDAIDRNDAAAAGTARSSLAAGGAVGRALDALVARRQAAAELHRKGRLDDADALSGDAPQLAGVRALVAQSETEKAVLELERLLAADTGDHEAAALLVELLKRRGLALYGEGDVEGAAACWRRALEIDPADGETSGYLKRARAVRRNL